MCVSLEMVKRAASPPDAVQTLMAAGDSSLRTSRPGRCLCLTAVNEVAWTVSSLHSKETFHL